MRTTLRRLPGPLAHAVPVALIAAPFSSARGDAARRHRAHPRTRSGAPASFIVAYAPAGREAWPPVHVEAGCAMLAALTRDLPHRESRALAMVTGRKPGDAAESIAAGQGRRGALPALLAVAGALWW